MARASTGDGDAGGKQMGVDVEDVVGDDNDVDDAAVTAIVNSRKSARIASKIAAVSPDTAASTDTSGLELTTEQSNSSSCSTRFNRSFNRASISDGWLTNN